MSGWFPRLAFTACCVVLGFLSAPAPAAHATPVATYVFDIDAPIVPGQGWGIPADCSTWHELYPMWCTPHHQAAYQDNDQDGLVSVCDNIVENGGGACWHIERVTATYFFTPVTGGGQNAAEPTDPGPNSPVCDLWHIIFADGPPFSYCQSVHIENWTDGNQNGVLDACDLIQIGGLWYHIDRVGCDVTVTFNPTTRAKAGTWGWLKGLFRR